MTRIPARFLADRDGNSYAIRLTTHTGLVLVGYSRHRNVQGTFEHCIGAYESAQHHNRLLGWGSVAFLRNHRALGTNRKAATHLCSLSLQLSIRAAENCASSSAR